MRSKRTTSQGGMVDVGAKRVTARAACAEVFVALGPAAAAVLREGRCEKGDVLATARVAAVLAAKRTPDLIPLCHPIPLDAVAVSAEQAGDTLRIETEVRTRARTGVEMEALAAAAAAALTVYDMLKPVAPGIVIGPLRLIRKSGGRSGRWRADDRSR